MAYTWAAVYSDGSVFNQMGKDEKPHSITMIDRTKMIAFVLLGHADEVILRQHFEPGHRLIYRKRVKQQMNASTMASGATICHMVGWQKNVKGENVQHIAYCFEDGRIELAGAYDPGHAWFYPIVSVPGDEQEVASASNLLITPYKP